MNNFELQSDIIPYKNMKKEVEKTREKWNLLFEFNDNLDNLSKEEWIGIRHKAFGLMQDFTMNWQDKIKKR